MSPINFCSPTIHYPLNSWSDLVKASNQNRLLLCLKPSSGFPLLSGIQVQILNISCQVLMVWLTSPPPPRPDPRGSFPPILHSSRNRLPSIVEKYSSLPTQGLCLQHSSSSNLCPVTSSSILSSSFQYHFLRSLPWVLFPHSFLIKLLVIHSVPVFLFHGTSSVFGDYWL